jgi:hypothetical protein
LIVEAYSKGETRLLIDSQLYGFLTQPSGEETKGPLQNFSDFVTRVTEGRMNSNGIIQLVVMASSEEEARQIKAQGLVLDAVVVSSLNEERLDVEQLDHALKNSPALRAEELTQLRNFSELLLSNGIFVDEAQLRLPNSVFLTTLNALTGEAVSADRATITNGQRLIQLSSIDWSA